MRRMLKRPLLPRRLPGLGEPTTNLLGPDDAALSVSAVTRRAPRRIGPTNLTQRSNDVQEVAVWQHHLSVRAGSDVGGGQRFQSRAASCALGRRGVLCA